MRKHLFTMKSLSDHGFRRPPSDQNLFLFGPRRRKRTTYQQACYAVWACGIMGWTQAQAADVIGLHPSTVNAILHGRLFAAAYPIPLPQMRGRAPANDNQPDFGF